MYCSAEVIPAESRAADRDYILRDSDLFLSLGLARFPFILLELPSSA